MTYLYYITKGIFNKWGWVVLLLLPILSRAEKLDWKINAPFPESIITNQNLFVCLEIAKEYEFASATKAQVFLDNALLNGIAKVNGNKLTFFYPGYLRDGKHQLRVEVKIAHLKHTRITQWNFYVGRKDSAGKGNVPMHKETWKLSGFIAADNRNEFLSGSGQSLRQEPASTRTLSIDAMAKYKDASIYTRGFLTSNNISGLQSMNYFAVGYRNKWLDAEAGDINPLCDRLVLGGVRMRGYKLRLKYRSSSIQFYYGTLNQAIEGSLQLYIPGSGVLPTNLINDSQYIVPGTYKRNIMAMHIETGNKSDNFKLGFTGLKVKDDIHSVQYGLAPKDNIAGGADLVIKMIHRSVIIQSGIAGSIYTDDISNGPLDRKSLDSIYNIKLGFEPETYRNIIILNSSTIPTSLSGSDYISYYSQLNYNNKYQNFSFEYRKNGPLFTSLGNPFLRNNYDGFSAGDRFSLFKRKINIDLRYQNYNNDLNLSLPSKVNTVMYNGNLFINPGKYWPSIMFNYLTQLRNGSTYSDGLPAVNETVDNYMLNINLSRRFWNIGHNFRLMLNMNDRKDRVNALGGFTMYNIMFGLNESISNNLNINADIGKALIKGDSSITVSNINTYNLSIDWRIKPGKYYTSLAFSNNTALATALSNPSYRLSLIARFGYKFYKGMGIDIEGGYQPYRDQTNSTNNYNDAYIYIRYSCDLGMLKLW